MRALLLALGLDVQTKPGRALVERSAKVGHLGSRLQQLAAAEEARRWDGTAAEPSAVWRWSPRDELNAGHSGAIYRVEPVARQRGHAGAALPLPDGFVGPQYVMKKPLDERDHVYHLLPPPPGSPPGTFTLAEEDTEVIADLSQPGDLVAVTATQSWTKGSVSRARLGPGPYAGDPSSAASRGEEMRREREILRLVHAEAGGRAEHVLQLVDYATLTLFDGSATPVHIPGGYVYKEMTADLEKWRHQTATPALLQLCGARLAAQIAQGLSSIHSSGFMHSDADTNNVYYLGTDADGCPANVQVADLGIAQPLVDDAGVALHRPPWGGDGGTATHLPTRCFVDHSSAGFEAGTYLDWCALATVAQTKFGLAGYVPFAAPPGAELTRCGKMGLGRKVDISLYVPPAADAPRLLAEARAHAAHDAPVREAPASQVQAARLDHSQVLDHPALGRPRSALFDDMPFKAFMALLFAVAAGLVALSAWSTRRKERNARADLRGSILIGD